LRPSQRALRAGAYGAIGVLTLIAPVTVFGQDVETVRGEKQTTSDGSARAEAAFSLEHMGSSQFDDGGRPGSVSRLTAGLHGYLSLLLSESSVDKFRRWELFVTPDFSWTKLQSENSVLGSRRLFSGRAVLGGTWTPSQKFSLTTSWGHSSESESKFFPSEGISQVLYLQGSLRFGSRVKLYLGGYSRTDAGPFDPFLTFGGSWRLTEQLRLSWSGASSAMIRWTIENDLIVGFGIWTTSDRWVVEYQPAGSATASMATIAEQYKVAELSASYQFLKGLGGFVGFGFAFDRTVSMFTSNRWLTARNLENGATAIAGVQIKVDPSGSEDESEPEKDEVTEQPL
jgi:hypothetical protein